MKKLILVVAVLLVLGGVAYYVRGRWISRQPMPKLRAMMHDENTPRSPRPSLGVQVNDGVDAAVLAGTPLWLTVGVSNPGKTATIALGDASRPWTAAVEFVSGGQKLDLPLLGAAPQPVELDETTSAEANFGTASASLVPGTYLVQACLGATGTWKGRECSTPVRLTVLERPQQLTPEQEIAIARRTGRYGLRAGDLQALEAAGQRLLAADPGSIPGHMYVGEAKFRQGLWEDALREFTAARTQSKRRHPNLLDNPVALDLRISQVLEKLGAGQ